MNHPFRKNLLGNILVAKGFLTQANVDSVLDDDGEFVGEKLIRKGLLTEKQLAEALAEQLHTDYVELDDFNIDPEMFELVPADFAYKYSIIPRQNCTGTLSIVTADPFDISLIDRLENMTGCRVVIEISSQDAIRQALQRSKGRAAVFKGVTEDFWATLVRENEVGEEIVRMDNPEDESAPVIRLVNSMLGAALQKRASDIHIETYETGIIVKYRIDGVLYPATEVLDRRYHSSLISRLKVMAEMDIAEKRIPQDGRFKLRMNDHDIDCRVSILPSVYGEDVVIRILDQSSISDGMMKISLNQLGLEEGMLKSFRRAVREPYGMVLISGPTGSGKTTTLYAALAEMNSGDEKIITIEEPVEYQLEGVVQIPVNEKKQLTFAKGLRSILRHDPDKIMVGEIRDADTAQIAVQSALTGHLVLSTVHANNVFDVIGRFSHMGIDLYNFVSALNCVVGQRLVRKNCPDCRRSSRVSDEELELSGLDPATYRDHFWYEGDGCESCNGTGYLGRFAITELLDLTPHIRDMIVSRRPVSEIEQAAIAEGFTTLRQSAMKKAIDGETSLHEINRVTFVD